MKIEQKKKNKNKTQTIVDLEAMIEPTRLSYKHLRLWVWGSVPVDIKTKTVQMGGGRREGGPTHKNQHLQGATTTNN